MFSISIYNCSAVLYNQYVAVGAHAGSPQSIEKWIEKTQNEIGKCKVYGWHKIKNLKK